MAKSSARTRLRLREASPMDNRCQAARGMACATLRAGLLRSQRSVPFRPLRPVRPVVRWLHPL